MRDFIYIFAISIILVACDSRLLLPQAPFSECYIRDSLASRSGRESPIIVEEPKVKLEPHLYYCAVDFDQSYDWVRDTLYGEAAYNLILYKDDAAVLSIESSTGLIRPEAYTHHIVEGHLYTEAVINGQTIIARDGEELLRFDEVSVLVALLPHNGELYTITKDRYRDDYKIRCGTRLLYDLPKSKVFGDMSDTSYGNTGALYLDDGKVCFAYQCAKHYYVCQGEKQVELPYDDYKDIKMIDGKIVSLCSTHNGLFIDTGQIWRFDEPVMTAQQRNSSTGLTVFRGTGNLNYPYADLSYWVSPTSNMVVYSREDDEKIYIVGEDEYKYEIDDSYLFLNSKCAVLYEDDCYAAFSPTDNALSPIIVHNAQEKPLYIHGYVSQLAICLLPP